MSQSEVFRPSNGPLLVRSNLATGLGRPSERRKTPGTAQSSRPGTSNSGYRFGQLSHNSFFARHNPHPGRVRHIKGLLDVPICSVNDDGYFASPRYSMQFPPNAFNNKKLMAANSINVNSQMYPINTITGLQYFVGKPLNGRIFREKAVPKVGLVPMTESWRDELRALTEAVGIAPNNKPREQAKVQETAKPRTSQYSTETGRLIPPPSRALSRGVSRSGSRMNHLQHIMEENDSENMVLQMLCQILQTEDVNAVQAWLCSAGDREKQLVLDLIRSALSNQQEYYNADPHNGHQPMDQPPAGTNFDIGQSIGDHDGNADRLSLDNAPAYRPPSITRDQIRDPIFEEDEVERLPDVFRQPKSAGGDRPSSRLSSRARSRGSKTPGGAGLAPLTSGAKLRYTQTPIQDQDINKQKASLNAIMAEGGDNEGGMWQQDQSFQ